MLNRLFAILLAVALSFAPLAAPAMAEMQPQASYPGEMASNCDEPPAPAFPDEQSDICCVATCLGIVIAPAAAQPLEFDSPALRPSVQYFRRGLPAELPTPPPRAA